MQTLKVKNAIKDAFKALHPEVEFFIVNNATKNLPKQDQEESEVEYLDRCYQEVEDFRKILQEHPNVYHATKKLVGYNRQPGVHPCGMAITQDPLEEFAPMRDLKGKWVLEYGADDAAFSGIIKYDVLSVKTLQYFDVCFKQIKKQRGIDVSLDSIPVDDKATFEAFMKGDTESVFQFNSDVAIAILTAMRVVASVDDLSLVTSVGRPGPMKNGQHFEFVKRANGNVAPEPPHESLRELLKDTYGIMIYQEGVMKASQILGGFSLAEADDIRKAMGKKDIKVIKPYKDRFIANAIKAFPDIDQKRAEDIWQLMETFSGYGFNKSHSMSYALIGYYCQYLKVHYPLEWWLACLTNANEEHMPLYYEACKQFVNRPDINISTDKFEIIDGRIQMPLSVIKGIGDTAAAEIERMRPFKDLPDFFDRVNKTKVNKKVVQQLIFAGAFDTLHDNVDRSILIQLYYQLRKEDVPEELQGLDRSRLADYENKALDFIIPDYHQIYPEFFSEAQGVVDIRKLTKAFEGRSVTLGGRIEEIKPVNFKNKKTGAPGLFHKLTLMNAGLTFQSTLWSDEFQLYGKDLKKGDVVTISGEVSFFRDMPQLKLHRLFNISKYGKDAQ